MLFAKFPLTLRLFTTIFGLLLNIRPASSISWDCGESGNATSEEEWPSKIKEGILPCELKEISMPPDYDKSSKVGSGNETKPPQLKVFIMSSNFVEDLQECNVSVRVIYKWTDQRLRVVNNHTFGFFIPPSALRHVWNPNLYVYNHDFMDETHDTHFRRLPKPSLKRSLVARRDGMSNVSDDFVRFEATVDYSFTLSSDTGYTFYPYDKHEFRFTIGQGLNWTWESHITPIVRKEKYSTFHIASRSGRDTKFFPRAHIDYGIGFFEVVILFVRKVQAHLIRVYIPSGLFVVLTWLSMFLPVELVTERVALCTGTLLTITMFFNTASQLGPSVNYLRAVDVWLLACISFIFIILFENVGVMKITGRFNKIQPKSEHSVQMKRAFENILPFHLGGMIKQREEGPGELGGGGGGEVGNKFKSVKMAMAEDELQVGVGVSSANDSSSKFQAAMRVDRVSLIGITAGILIFNVVYWIWLLASNQTD